MGYEAHISVNGIVEKTAVSAYIKRDPWKTKVIIFRRRFVQRIMSVSCLRFPSLGQTIDNLVPKVLILSLLEDGYLRFLWKRTAYDWSNNDPAVQSVMKVTGEARIMDIAYRWFYRGCCTVSRRYFDPYHFGFIALLSHGAIALKDYVYTKQERDYSTFLCGFQTKQKKEAMSETDSMFTFWCQNCLFLMWKSTTALGCLSWIP